MNKKWSLIAAAVGMMVLILDAKSSAAAAAQAVEICLRTVIPSLFPFFLLSGCLTRNLQGGYLAARFFGSCKNCAGVILTGLLGGYPVGANAAAEAHRTGILSKQQADRLLFFCSQAGPSFFFGMVAAQFDSAKDAWILWGIQLLSAFTVANLIPEHKTGFIPGNKKERTGPDPMQSALKAMASVCGWVLIFAVILQFLKRWVLWLLPMEMKVLLCGLLELTNGCLMLTEIENPSLRFLIAAVMLNFGGLCVLLQTASVCSGLELRNYVKGKLLQTGFAFLYALPFPGRWVAGISVLALIFVKSLGLSAKTCSIPRKNGV